MTSYCITVTNINMVSGDSIDIGHFTYDDDPENEKVYSKFFLNWTAINAIFNSKRKDLILEAVVDGMFDKIKTKQQLAAHMAAFRSPYSSLQFQTPQESSLPPEELLQVMYEKLLLE